MQKLPTSSGPAPITWETIFDTETVIDGFLDEYVKANSRCALNRFAAYKQELWDQTVAFSVELHEQPEAFYIDGSTCGLLEDRSLQLDAISPSPYKACSWNSLARGLARWLEGDATEDFLAYTESSIQRRVDDADVVVTSNDGASGSEIWPPGRKGILELLVPFTRPVHGQEHIRTGWEC
ncbi:hypothetical protein F5Y15DRAFT_418843 [Xylariaceae sp. FL0016]|nr:hypothetical protein F5Y15DRAFT_418843 [Xylariaceae sp. FL0016]